MHIDLNKTLERIEKIMPREGEITFGMLEKAYEQTLRLRSQLLGVMYDMMDFGSAKKDPTTEKFPPKAVVTTLPVLQFRSRCRASRN